MSIAITPARPSDLPEIAGLLAANHADPSLFQQPAWQLARWLPEFLVARDQGRSVGCIQVHPHPRGSVELLAVAVRPDQQGRGVGSALMAAAVARALVLTRGPVWLGTAKPGYFARHGFTPFSRWRLPLVVLLGKVPRVFQQPVRRWLPSLFGRHVFMRLVREPAPLSPLGVRTLQPTPL